MDSARWLKLAQEKFDEGNYFKVRDMLDNALQFDPDLDDARKLRALTFIHLGEFEFAEGEYRNLLEKNRSIDNLLKHAGLLLVLNKPVLARAEFEEALDIEPQNTDAIKGTGDSYFQQSNFIDAQSTYDRLLDLTPDDPYVWYAKAEAYYRALDHERAFECIEKAIDLAPAAEFFAFKGDFYIRHDNFERALEQYILARKHAPDDAEINLRLGFIYRVLDRQRDSLHSFEDALKINPYLVEALENKIQILKSMDREDQAVFTMEQLVRLEPEDSRRSLELAQHHLDTENYEKAEEFFDITLKHNPEHTEAWYGKCYALFHLEKYEEMKDAITKTLELYPDADDLNELLSKID